MRAKPTRSRERSIVKEENFQDSHHDREEFSDTSQNSSEVSPQLPQFPTQAARRNVILVSVDGIQSGVPTLTTSTLTPTTLRSIEETFTQLINEPINAPYQAGFIPPPLAPFTTSTMTTTSSTCASLPAIIGNNFKSLNEDYETEAEDSQTSWNPLETAINDNSLETTDTSSAATDSFSAISNGNNGYNNSSLMTSFTSLKSDSFSSGLQINTLALNKTVKEDSDILSNTSSLYTKDSSDGATTSSSRRNQGGRRPMKSANLTPEEEEKRRIRRERNKLAAARCRKRRVDQTNELLEEVAILEKKREGLQKDIECLNVTKQELEYVLEAHKPTCQKNQQEILNTRTFGGLVVSATNINETNPSCKVVLDRNTTVLPSRNHSPIDLKPLTADNVIDMVQGIKHEPVDDNMLDSSSSFEHDDSGSPKRILLTRNNPMIPPPLPNLAALSPALSIPSASLNTPIITTTPLCLSYFNNTAINAISTINKVTPPVNNCGSKQRPNTLPNVPRNQSQKLDIPLDNKPPTDINGVAIQTPSTGMFNFESLMDGGTGLTPVSGPLVPTCSSQNKAPHDLPTPTSEASKLVSL